MKTHLATALLSVAALAASPAWAATDPARAAVQPGIGPTGSMYDGNNTIRSKLALRPPDNPPAPAAGGSGTTSTSGESRDELGTGAAGGER
jgi:hypothetical protein